jgi:hypothetical protein
MKKEFKEALGVPSNLINTANKLYDLIINIIPPSYTFEELDGFNEVINGEFEIGDHTFSGVNFEINLREHDTLEIAGMHTGEKAKVTDKFKFKTKLGKKFELGFNFVGPRTTTGQDIIDLIKKEKLEFVGSISHELKHRYDKFKNPKMGLGLKSRYVVASNRGFGDIRPINEFIHYLYYTHIVESLVRPSEIAALIETGEISKKDFYKFLTDTRTFKRLSNIRNFDYNEFKENIKSEIPKIKELFDFNDISYEGMSDDEILEKTLDLVYKNLRDWEASFVHQRLLDNPLEALFGFTGAKDTFFQNYLKNMERFGNDYNKFFNYEIKLMNYIGDKMIRKISKLYDMARDTKNESIINWDLWRMINENNQKISKEFRFKHKKK